MCYHVDLAEARRRAIPVVERTNRNLATDCRVETCTSSLAAACRNLYIPEHAVDAGCADGKNTITVCGVELQSAVSLECRQHGRDHHLEPLAAHPIRSLPQHRQRIFYHRAVCAPAVSRGPNLVRCDSLISHAHRMLAVPARHRA